MAANTARDTTILQPPSDHASMEFTRFPEFPKEIQVKIWQAACSVPRIISLTDSFRVVNGPPPLPGVFAVCKESRHEALNAYK
jgi:2EXR family